MPKRSLVADTGEPKRGRILLREAKLEGTDLEGETLFGARLKVPLDQLAALDLLQGLSSLPVRTQADPL